MQNSSNPNSASLSRPPKRFLKKGLLTFATCMALADEVFAQSTTSPWTQAVQALQTAFTGPIATGLILSAHAAKVVGAQPAIKPLSPVSSERKRHPLQAKQAKTFVATSSVATVIILLILKRGN